MGFGETFKIQITAIHSSKRGPFSRNDSLVLFIHTCCWIRQPQTACFLSCSRDISPASSAVPFGGLGMSQMPLYSLSLQKLAGRSSYLTLLSWGGDNSPKCLWKLWNQNRYVSEPMTTSAAALQSTQQSSMRQGIKVSSKTAPPSSKARTQTNAMAYKQHNLKHTLHGFTGSEVFLGINRILEKIPPAFFVLFCFWTEALESSEHSAPQSFE